MGQTPVSTGVALFRRRGTCVVNWPQKASAFLLRRRMMPSDGPRCHPSLLPARSWPSPDRPISGPLMRAEGNAMSTIPVMLIIWGVVAACFLALLAYRGQLTRYEEDQLFLGDQETNEQQEQNEIVRKVNKIAPVIRVLGFAAAAMTISIVGIFTYDAWQRLR